VEIANKSRKASLY